MGTTETTIVVTEAPPGVELSKSTATIERTLDQSFVENVAVSTGTREATNLALLTPTAIRAPGSTTIAADGQRARNDNFMIDGTDNNDTVSQSKRIVSFRSRSPSCKRWCRPTRRSSATAPVRRFK